MPDNDITLPGVNAPIPKWFLFLAVGGIVAILLIRRKPAADEENQSSTDALLASEFNRRLMEQWELFQDWLNQAYPIVRPVEPVLPPPNQKPRTPPDICQGDPLCEGFKKGLPLPYDDHQKQNPIITDPPQFEPGIDLIPVIMPSARSIAYTPNVLVDAGGYEDELNGFGDTYTLETINRAVEYQGVKLPLIVAENIARITRP
jgi:hypothetical protein